MRDGFRTHAATLRRGHPQKYAWALGEAPAELADEPLLALDVPRLASHQRLMLDHGATANTVREVMARLSGILQIAVEHGHLPANPARALRKVPRDAAEDVDPLAPVELERLIAGLTAATEPSSLLGGHLGLRPLEIRCAPWGAFNGSTLVIGRSRTKRTAARTRTIAVPDVPRGSSRRGGSSPGVPVTASPSSAR